MLEDDAALLLKPNATRQAIRKALSELNAKRPEWLLLMLGGSVIGGFRAPVTSNSHCGLASCFAAECEYQSP